MFKQLLVLPSAAHLLATASESSVYTSVPQSCFELTSRSWKSPYPRCSLQLVKSEIIELGASIHFIPATKKVLEEGAAAAGKYKVVKRGVLEIKSMRLNAMERAASKMKGKSKFAAHTTLMFNCYDEPAVKYNINLLADRGFDEQEWTATRLKKEVLYLESLHNM